MGSPQSAFGFDTGFLQRLERLALANRKPVIGPAAGPRRSPARGSSVEFADYRSYTEGDDVRRVDWGAYARLDRLFVRLYQAEHMTTLTLLIDHSPSMTYGGGPKATAAGRIAAVLSYIALHQYDRVGILGWGDRIDKRLAPQSGTRSVPLVWQSIADVVAQPSGPTNFAALRGFTGASSGLSVVLSDFLTDSDWRGGLGALQMRGQEVIALQILSPEEIDPTLRGEWTLRDAETGDEVEVTLSPRALQRYREELESHVASLRTFCHRRGMTFVQISSGAALEDDVLMALHDAGALA